MKRSQDHLLIDIFELFLQAFFCFVPHAHHLIEVLVHFVHLGLEPIQLLVVIG